MDPILKQRYLCDKHNLPIEIDEEIDLFKADIYSLALAFFRILTGEYMKEINEKEELFKLCNSGI